MKYFASYLLGALFLGPFTIASADSVFTCTPTKPTPLVSQVILDQDEGLHATLTLVTLDANGQRSVASDKAEYYDDMTYFGYFSETLKAAIEFWGYPSENSALLRLSDKIVNMECQIEKKH